MVGREAGDRKQDAGDEREPGRIVAPVSARRSEPLPVSDAGERPTPLVADEAPTTGFDEAAEAAFLADAHERGEVVAPAKSASVDPVEEVETKPLPSLGELVQKIPAEVRDVLDDLFRARFVTVKRVPKKALKP